MKNVFLALLLFWGLLFVSCKSTNERPIPEGYQRGVVLKTMNSGGYTYMQIDEDGKEYWIAAKMFIIKKDDTVYFSGVSEMSDFRSETLNRTFDKIFFIEEITTDPWAGMEAGKSMKGMAGGNPHKSIKSEKVEGITFEPLKDGYSIEYIYKNKKTLSGKPVKVRGQVIKYNAGIMGRNWVHIQDGTGSNSEFDILITTQESAKVGDVVSFEGVLAVDKDFGNGYKFGITIENATYIKEMKKI